MRDLYRRVKKKNGTNRFDKQICLNGKMMFWFFFWFFFTVHILVMKSYDEMAGSFTIVILVPIVKEVLKRSRKIRHLTCSGDGFLAVAVNQCGIPALLTLD